MVNLQINERDRIQMRQRCRQLLPGNPDTVECQKAVLKMIEGVLPAAELCSRNADASLWPRVQRREVSMRDARRKCGGYLSKLVGITIVENLGLEQKPAQALQQAWIALETFGQVMSPEETIKIRAFQDHILAALLSRESQPTVSRKDAVKTVNAKTVEIHAMKTEPVSVLEPISTYEEADTKKKKPLAGIIGIVAAILVLAVVGVGVLMGTQNMKVGEVESAISAIGTVTLESSGAIMGAELAYGELTEDQQAKVENYNVLVEARAEYDRLEKLVQEAVDAINGIGKVTLNSGSKIEKARRAYEALKPDELIGYVVEEAKILTTAEAEYENLCVVDLFDKASAQLANKDYEAALAGFKSLLEKYPNSSKAPAAKDGAAACMVGMAQAAFDENDYESAMGLLVDARKNYADSEDNKNLLEKLEKKLASIRPANKKIINKKDSIGWGWGKLTVTAGSKDACFRIIAVDENGNYDPATVKLFYVRAGETVEVNVKNGKYKVQYTSGDYWFNDTVGFGANAVYKEVSRDYNYDSWREGSYVYYYNFDLTLYDANSGDFVASPITGEKFWN